MSKMPQVVSKIITEHEDGYSVAWDFGEAGGGVDRVYIPPRDPGRAARNRAQLNAVLARYGYVLAEKEGESGGSQAPNAG